MILKERDKYVCDKTTRLSENDTCLLILNKFVRPFPTYVKLRGKLISEVHYMIERRHLRLVEKLPNYSLKNLKYFGVISPSGKVNYYRIHRTLHIDDSIKFVFRRTNLKGE